MGYSSVHRNTTTTEDPMTATGIHILIVTVAVLTVVIVWIETSR